MFKLRATILKDIRILTRDKVGLILMLAMPVLLAIVITSVQNSTFELVNDNKVPLLLYNKDKGPISEELIKALDKIGIFELKKLSGTQTEKDVISRMHAKDALVAIIIPANYSEEVLGKAKRITQDALKNIDVIADTVINPPMKEIPLLLYYHPVLQQSFRNSIDGGLRSALQLVQSRYIVKRLYSSINEHDIPDSLENQITSNQTPVTEIPVSRDGSRNIPNATQHNIPAWTIFAMFFIVISLGSSIVREKLSGSFIRLRTLPTSFMVALASKQITYLLVTLLQAALIFSIGVWLFPKMGLPSLNLPGDKVGLLLVTLACGWCATSFAICIGVFAQTQEQANGFGAVSIVILAAIGGLLVPAFAMPASFRLIMQFSPLHWCLEAYYGLFLEGGKLKDILMNIIPLLIITVILQLIAIYGLKRKNLI
ncbi:MAG: transporter permease subunit [Chitinophagaceae bacterium]|nr:transporter permease subunit [Chitinophagaceae bacterium]